VQGLRARGHSVVETSSYDKETMAKAERYDAVVVDWCGIQAIHWSKNKPNTKLVLRMHGADLAASDIVKRVEWSAFDAVISVRAGCETLIPLQREIHVIGYAVSTAGTFVQREFGNPHRLGVCCPDTPGCGVDVAVKQWLAVDGRDGGKAGKWNLMVCAFEPWQYSRIAQVWRRCSHVGMGNRVGLLGLDQMKGLWRRIEVAWSAGDDRAPDLPTLRAMATGAYPLVADRGGAPAMFDTGAYFDQGGFLVRLGLWNELTVEEKAVVSRGWHQFVADKNGVEKIAAEAEEVLSDG
jgi:hypothetical protein